MLLTMFIGFVKMFRFILNSRHFAMRLFFIQTTTVSLSVLKKDMIISR